jgi:hypothetical protein
MKSLSMKSLSMKGMSSKICIVILVILLVVCLLFDGNMMDAREGFYVLPPPPPRMINNIPKSAPDLKQMERTIPPTKNITLNIKVNDKLSDKISAKVNDKEKVGLATGGAALMLLNSRNPTPTLSTVEGFANPGDCLLPIPLGNDTPNSNTPFGMQFAPNHYKKNGKPSLFDMVEQPTDPKYPLLVLP